jgi:hypothetical protein
VSLGAPDTGTAGNTTTVVLPPGVQVQPGRETSQTNGQGQVVQGMLFPVTLPGGSTTTVFVPYTQLTDSNYVLGLIKARVDSILAITG